MFGVQKLQVDPGKVCRKKMGPADVCPACGEVYPTRDGDRCRSFPGGTSYTDVAAFDIKTKTEEEK